MFCDLLVIHIGELCMYINETSDVILLIMCVLTIEFVNNEYQFELICCVEYK